MSGEIIRDSPNSVAVKHNVANMSGYPQPTLEQRNFRPQPKTRRSKTPSRDLRDSVPANQFSSADSEIEIMIDQEPNRLFYEHNRPGKRGRPNKKEVQRRSKSRERSLDNTVSSLAPSNHYMQQNADSYDAGSHSLYHQPPQWIQQRAQSHQRSATLPPRQQRKQSLNESEINELLELRVRSEQMESTLRWWSDCTANWREKWTKVRAERNRAREEVKQMKYDVEEAQKELVVLRQQRALLVEENTILRNETRTKEESMSEENHSVGSDVISNGITKPYKVGNQQKHGNSNSGTNRSNNKMDEDQLSQKVVELQLRVEESAKTVQAERDSKLNLNKSIEQLEQELSSIKQKYNEIKEAKQEVLKQLTRNQESHRSEVVRINQSLEEELENRSKLEKKIHDLREEIERLQEENTSEWGKRERLETEKLQLERDNKRMKSVIDELKTSLDRKMKGAVEDRENELRQAQAEVHDLNEELNDVRRQAARDQKLLDDKQQELDHSRRRAEQHEAEVKTLRTRVEEIKKQQTSTEDELDNAQNQIRKLLRVVEEREEEAEKLHMQINQMQSRMRRDPLPTVRQKPPQFKRKEMENALSSSDSSCEI